MSDTEEDAALPGDVQLPHTPPPTSDNEEDDTFTPVHSDHEADSDPAEDVLIDDEPEAEEEDAAPEAIEVEDNNLIMAAAAAAAALAALAAAGVQVPAPAAAAAAAAALVAVPAVVADVTGSQITATNFYDGTTDVDIYIAHVERNQVQFRWTQNQTAAVIKNKLQGEAASWLHFLTQTNQVVDTWDLLRVALRNRFQLEFNEQTARKAVMNLNQKDQESVHSFYERITDAMDKKNHGYTADEKQQAPYQDALLRDIFTFFSAGLKQDIVDKAMAGANPPRTAADLLRAARIVEVQLEKEKSHKLLVSAVSTEEEKKLVPETSAATAASKLEQEVAALQEGFKSLRGQWNGRRNFRQRGGFRGRSFGGRGNFGRGFQQRSGNPRGRPANLTCFKCNGTGHYSFECPSQQAPPVQGANRGRGRGSGSSEVNTLEGVAPWFTSEHLN